MHCKKIPRAHAFRLAKTLRMDPHMRTVIAKQLRSLLEESAIEVTLAQAEKSAAMRARFEVVARSLNIPITVRKTATGLVIWKQTPDEPLEESAAEAQKTSQLGQQ
jgi:hypothetical protein